MTRRDLFAGTGAAALGVSLRGAPGGVSARYRDYSRCLPDYIRAQAERAYRLRNAALAKLTTPAAIAGRQRWVTETFWKLAGGMPERTPLNARTLGGLEREGYRLEKVVYESQPNFHVSANLYIPSAGRPPLPGVLVQMGHTLDGKAGYQRLCQWLARFGFLVLGFDPMGQGERTYYPGRTLSRSRLGADEEHTRPGRQMLLKGDTSMRLQTWDAVRSLDYLASHPLVDPKRLASTGQSGGGTNTMLLAAVDDRLAAAAVCCGNTENIACADFNPPGSTDDGEQNPVGGGPVGFDRWDLLHPLAPKPLLVLASDKDFFGTYSPNYIRSGEEEFGKLKQIYARLGHADRIAWFGTPLPHGLAYDLRLEIYNWLARWLRGESKRIEEEPEARMEEEAALFAAPSGSTVKSFGSETPFTMNRKRTVAKTPAPLERLLALDRPPQQPAVTLARASYRKSRIEAVEFAAAGGVWIPAWLFLPKSPEALKSVVVLLEPAGRTAWHEDELYDRLAREGCAVCAPDLRGIGDLTPEFGRHAARNAREHANDEMWAWSSLVFGKPLAGQRVTDLLAVIQGLRGRPELKGKRFIMAARGAPCVPALFTAALERAVDGLYLAGGLVSFQSIVETEDYNHPFGNFVPNLLLHTDLPELAASLAPRRVVLAGAVDGAGKRMEAGEVRKQYGSANVEVLPEILWDSASILRV